MKFWCRILVFLKLAQKWNKNLAKIFFKFQSFQEIHKRMEQNFGEDLLFKQENSTKLLEPSHLFL